MLLDVTCLNKLFIHSFIHTWASVQSPVTCEIVGSTFLLRTHDTYVKRVSQRFTKSRGFSPGAPVSSHRESMLT
jgi:hypothetical protein